MISELFGLVTGGPDLAKTRQRVVRYVALLLCATLLDSGAVAGQSQPPAPAPQGIRPTANPPPETGPAMLLQSDLDCTFAIDDQPKQSLKAGDTVRISVTLGQHLVTAVSADGKDRWKTVVDADKPVQKVVLIELVKVRAARQAAERQVAQLKQEIAAKERQVKELREKTEASQQQQAAVGTQRKRNEDQVNALGTLMPVPSIEKTPAFRVAYVPFRAHWGTMTVGKAEISFRAEDEKVSFDFVFRDVQDVKSSLYATNKFGPGLQIRLKDGKRYRFATYNNYGSLMDAINRAMAQSK